MECCLVCVAQFRFSNSRPALFTGLPSCSTRSPCLQNRGFSYRKMERYEDAVADYSMAVQVSKPPLLQQSMLHCRKGGLASESV